jgi:hypothetical protein
MKVIIGFVVAMSSLGVILGQPPPAGVELVVKVEARRLAGQDVSEQTARIIDQMLPDGNAELRFVTDGRAVRCTLSGRMFGDDGTIRLLPHGSSDLHVLNPNNRTYRLEPENWRLFAGQKSEFEFQRTGTPKTILGYEAHRVIGAYRVDVPPFEGAVHQFVREVHAEIDNWCTAGLRVPAAMAKMMDMAQRWIGSGDPQYRQYREACPLPLQSSVRLSLFPGFEIVSTMQSIRQLSEIPPGAFRLPDGYRQAGKTAGGGAR